jgi:Tol biopolymer transport system component
MKRRLVLTFSLALSLAAFPTLGRATFIPGPPGKVVFASGRASIGIPNPSASDADARIWVADYPSGTPIQVTTLPAGTQHRHPNWSPDHSQIVYAAGKAFSGEYALWIVDLRDGSQTEFMNTAKGQDRPSWSPDGSEIAFGREGDLWVKGVAPGSEPVDITNTAGVTEERPVWSPDGNTLYYNRGPAEGRDIYMKSPVTPAGTETGILTEGGKEKDDWQPALSPDGKRLCFLRGQQNSSADLYTYNLNGESAPSEFAAIPLTGELNCVWSPDGTKIMYTQGAFEAGDLAIRDSNGKNPSLLSSYNVEKHFDGNVDWATNFSPRCDERSAGIDVNKFATIALSCTDPDAGFGKEPPTPTALESNQLEIVSPPSHGTIGGISADEKVIYTPLKDFRGTDTFTYTGSDGVSDATPATVTISVGLQGGGGDKTPPRISKIKVSPKRWRRGKKLASISLAPVGTTISFRLSEKARTTLSFQRKAKRKGKAKFVGAGRVTFSGKSGKNRVRMEGHLTKTRKLAVGTYRVVVSARDAAGNRAKRTGPTFTIVPG